MKRLGGIWPRVVSFENLLLAYRKARRGKGVHAAVNRYQDWARRNAYALKMDVAQYFPSIDHQILKEKLRRRIKDARVLALLERIIDTSPPVEQPPSFFPATTCSRPWSADTESPSAT